jgi:hypothetical protein
MDVERVKVATALTSRRICVSAVFKPQRGGKDRVILAG